MNKNVTNKKCYFNLNDECTALKAQDANCRGCIFFRDIQTDIRNNSLMAAFDRQRQVDYTAGLCKYPRTRS